MCCVSEVSLEFTVAALLYEILQFWFPCTYAISKLHCSLSFPQIAHLAKIKRSFKTFPSLKSPSWFVNSCQYCQYSFSCCWPPHSFRYFVMSAQAQRSRVIQLYKNLLYLGREYPQGYEYFRTRCHNAFMKNKDIQGEQVRWAATKKIFVILFLGGGMVSEGGLHHQRAGGSVHA